MTLENAFHKDLLKIENLMTGWHLTRKGYYGNFVELTFDTEVYSLNLKENLEEVKRKLAYGEYKFRDLIDIDVPKKGLGVRPGTVMHIEDAIVLNTIIYLISPSLNKHLPDSVYSFRLKKNQKKKKITHLFEESSIFDFPFLKSNTISKRYSNHYEWFTTWVSYDNESRSVINDYPFMATSDISAYFENIQLQLLKTEILKYLPNEQKIINILFDALLAWTVKSNNGERLHRGLPQGSQIFSFLGNFFLLPIDLFFKDYQSKNDIKYFKIYG